MHMTHCSRRQSSVQLDPLCCPLRSCSRDTQAGYPALPYCVESQSFLTQVCGHPVVKPTEKVGPIVPIRQLPSHVGGSRSGAACKHLADELEVAGVLALADR